MDIEKQKNELLNNGFIYIESKRSDCKFIEFLKAFENGVKIEVSYTFVGVEFLSKEVSLIIDKKYAVISNDNNDIITLIKILSKSDKK